MNKTLNFNELSNPNELKAQIRVIDLNGDNKNEVLYCFNSDDVIADTNMTYGIAFFDYKGKVFNKLAFTKTVYSKREILTPPYTWSLRDTLTFNGRKSLLSNVNNGDSYASASFILDLKTQKIISDTLWNCGHINEMKVIDLNNDGIKEIVGVTHDNGKKRISFFHINISKFYGQLPSTDEYKLLNIKQAEVNNLFLFPKTDYIEFEGQETANLQCGLSIDNNSKSLRFGTLENTLINIGGIIYNWNYQNNDFSIAIAGRFGAIRDSLVAQGKLQKPFTDSWEYRQLIHDQILRWNGKDFVTLKK